MDRIKHFLVRRWFLVALIGLFLLGLFLWKPLEPIASNKITRNSLLAAVLFVMALPLQASAVGRAFRKPLAPALAITINLGLLPLFAWLISPVLTGGMRGGLLVAAVTPCTLASASVWTRKAGGNDSVSMLVTVGTNLICFVVSPLWLLLMTGQSQEMNVGQRVVKLGLLVLLPMVVAQLLRVNANVAKLATKHKMTLSVVAQCGILSMVLVGAAGTGQRLATAAESPQLAEFALMLAAVLTIHLVMFWAGTMFGKRLGLPREDWIAVGFSGSQKTLMVGLFLATESGFSVLPMITYHISQLLVDTLIADRLAARTSTGETPSSSSG